MSSSVKRSETPNLAPTGQEKYGDSFSFDDNASQRTPSVNERGIRSEETAQRSDSIKGLKGPTVTEMMIEDYATKPGRSTRHNIAAVVIDDILIAMSSMYFIVFAILAYIWNNRPASDVKAKALLRAAHVGPTIFPIVFALILAKLIKAITTWRLEHGATVGLLEYLLGSRSLAAAFMAPVMFRTLNIFVPILVILWAFSPAGGPSALRIVTVEPLYTNTTVSFQYMNLLESRFTIEASSSGATYATGVNAAFNAALMSSSFSKNGTRRLWKYPNSDAGSTARPDRDDWYNTNDKRNVTYASLLGIPTLGVTDNSNSTFNIETSYFNVTCGVEADGPLDVTVKNQGWRVWYDASHFANTTAMPRFIGLKSYVNAAANDPNASPEADMQLTDATCALGTTYLEASIFCNATHSCNFIAIRESRIYHPSENISALDGIIISADYDVPDNNTDLRFFDNFANSISNVHTATSDPIEAFFIDPAFPYSASHHDKWYNIWPIGSILFSYRFAQLLNTYWLSVIAPSGVTGDFTSPSNDQYRVATARGTRTTMQLVMRCHMPYLIVLVIAAGIMLIAGILTAILNSVRRGPDVLEDGFVSSLRHNPFVNVDVGASMEDGAEKGEEIEGHDGEVGGGEA